MSHQLPELPYSFDALEPHIDQQTMQIHYTKHHQGYVNKLNAALNGKSDLGNWKIEDLLSHLNELPEDIRNAVRNNGGGHFNHSIFWSTLAPKNRSGQISDNFKQAINSQFGSYDNFKSEIINSASTRFGSGWAWVVVNQDGRLQVLSTANQDNPVSQGLYPVFGIDVWEHAYYLKYQNRRDEYLNAIFNVFNWNEISERFENARVLSAALKP